MRIEGGDGLKDLGESCQLTTPSLRKYTLPSLFLNILKLLNRFPHLPSKMLLEFRPETSSYVHFLALWVCLKRKQNTLKSSGFKCPIFVGESPGKLVS